MTSTPTRGGAGRLAEWWKPHTRIVDRKLSPREFRRNFHLGVANGATVTVAMAFIDPSTVLSWFLAQAGASNGLIGLVSPIRMGSSFLLQILVSGYIQRKPHKMPFYLTVGVLRVAVLVALSLVVGLVPVGSPWLVPGFFAVLVVYSLISGTIGLPFMDITAKSIPASQRARFFGRRNLWGSVLSLGVSAAVGYLLTEPLGLVFPRNIAVMFALSAVFLAITSAIWSRLVEPPGDVQSVRVGWSEQLRRGLTLLKANRPYRRYVLTRLALMPADWVTPFYVVYARDELGLAPEMIGVYLAARTVAAVFSNLAWTRLGDRRGNRILVQVVSALSIAVPGLALVVGSLIGRSTGPAPWQAYAFGLVYVALGTLGSGSMVAGMSYLLDIVPAAERALYLGFNNTLFGVARFAALASGFLMDWVGFRAMATVAVGFCLLSLVLSTGLADPPAHAAAIDST